MCVCTVVRDLYIALSIGGSWTAAHSPLFGRFLALKMQNFLRGALPRTPLGLPAPDPRLGLRPRPRVRRCRRPEAELRLQAKVARCRLSSKKIAIYRVTSVPLLLFLPLSSVSGYLSPSVCAARGVRLRPRRYYRSLTACRTHPPATQGRTCHTNVTHLPQTSTNPVVRSAHPGP